jgi:translation initiation factor IF-2
MTNSKVLLFGLKIDKKIQAEFEGIEIFSSRVIYDLDDKLEQLIIANEETEEFEKITGEAEITEKFYFSKVGNIAGCRVTQGTISRNNKFHVYRHKELLFTGQIESLQSNKLNIKEARHGQDCGIVFHKFDKFERGDKVVAFTIEKRKINE